MRAFVVSLDDPPEVRWREVARAYKRQIRKILRSSDDLQQCAALGPACKFACRRLLLSLPSEQRREVQGMACELGIEEHTAAAVQLMYEAAVVSEPLLAVYGQSSGTRVRAICNRYC